MKKNSFSKGVFVFLSCLLGLAACDSPPERVVAKSFYYWRSVWELSNAEKNALDSLHITKLYVKYFDIDWDHHFQQPMPKALLGVRSELNKKLEIVPTVYIVNDAMLRLPDSLVDPLAEKMCKKIAQTSELLGNPTVREIQVDCDWSEKSRDRYFALLRSIQKRLKIVRTRLSVTIRLHQVKYFQRTGVPPVDRGMLMFYNMGALNNPETQNSIFDSDVAKDYLYNFDTYPLPLDVALPLFSWGVVTRKGRVVKLVNELTSSELQKEANFKLLENKSFIAQERTLFHHYLFLKDDMLRLEEVDPALCLEAARLISPHVRGDSLTVALYHLNELTLKKYDWENLENIYRALH